MQLQYVTIFDKIACLLNQIAEKLNWMSVESHTTWNKKVM